MNATTLHIRYETQRDPAFTARVKSMPGCDTLDRCIQCGTCSGVCPMSAYMDRTPRQIIDLTREGFKDDVLSSNTYWLCSSCYACTVECPKQIKITDVMYGLKQCAGEEGAYPAKFPVPVLAREFFRMVRSRGRVTESQIARTLYLKTNIGMLFGMRTLGINLLKTGRLSLRSESIKNTEELTGMIDRAVAQEAKR